ncbi:MAG: ectonucleotide pyrophosphatase/phosphodiesterase, partial [Bacteroidales bacterium]|nr:ectonucleotide pyrophosphatase/phosphodiesterase [Bacteroidales bacterium]
MKLVTKYLLIASVLFIGFYFTSCKTEKQSSDKPYVVMLSVDGFRWDYPDKVETPNLDYIAKIGVKAQSLRPCFPSKTFPNHYSMATGLYPDNHGIVGNSFYAPDLDAHYAIRDRDAVENGDFYDGEPIWTTAEKQGVISGSYFWVGSEAPCQDIRPTYWKRYDHDFPFEQRIDSVIYWLKLPEEKRPHLITWYIHEPDALGHRYGPDSDTMKYEIHYLDSLIGVFMTKVNLLPHKDKINIIITSDHGMATIKKSKTVILENIIQEKWFDKIKGGSPVFNFEFNEEYRDTALAVLKSIEGLKVWEHGKLPERLHYGTNPRTLDLIVVADSSYNVVWKERRAHDGGNHGFDNFNTDMHAIFYAYGPAFKEKYSQATFNNIDLYPLIANILNLKPAKIDG